MSHAVIASSGSRSAGGARKGSMHKGRPLLRSGVQIRTSQSSSNLRLRATSPSRSRSSDSSIPNASRARSPCGSMMREGIPARAASSINAFAITVLPEPVEPNMAAWRARTCAGMSIGSPESLRSPRNIPFGLNFFFELTGVDGSRISSTSEANSDGEGCSSSDTITRQIRLRS